MPWEFPSPRDYNGHGTHTASTAGGNHDVQVTGPAAGFGKISGIAPRARIAAYKALWSTQDASTANGYYSDLVAAIDQAVADGVDVINYSVSGTAPTSSTRPRSRSWPPPTRASSSPPRAATAARPPPRWRTRPPGSPRSPPARTTAATQGSVTLGNGTTLHRRLAAATKVGPGAAHRRRRGGPARRRPGDRRRSARPPATTAARRCSTRPRSRARSCSATAA